MTPLTEPRVELQAPPPLCLQPPLCPMCGNQATSVSGGGWECRNDKASWGGLGIGWERGEWWEADIYACTSMGKHRPDLIVQAVDGWEWQCAKPLGHDGPHNSFDGVQWPNSWLIQSDTDPGVTA